MRLSIIIPTAGRLTIVRALESLRHAGLRAGDEVLVVADGPQPATHSVCLEFADLPIRYVVSTEHGHYGNAVRNFAHDNRLASGDYLIALDDDDLAAPFAAILIRAALAEAPGRPHLFRFRQLGGGLIWNHRGRIERGHIGGHCLVCPNDPAKQGRWDASRYDGDFDWIVSTLAFYQDGPVWRDEIIALQNAGRD